MIKSVPQSNACTEVGGAHTRTTVISMDRLAQYLLETR